MGELLRLRPRFIGFVVLAVAFGVQLEVESMQMHRMAEIGCIDQTPVNALAHLIVQPFRVRPRLAVDGRAHGPVPAFQHEDAVVGRCARRIHHQRPAQLRIDHAKVAVLSVRSPSPV